jgi:phage tail sheath protein FI
MPVQVSFPGVYVQEISSGVRTITGVSTSIALFIGMTRRGRLRAPTRVSSLADYERTFGNDITISEMTHQVRQFFINSGREAFVMRISDINAAPASVDLKNEAGDVVLKVSARDAGVDGNQIHLEVDYDTPSPDATFNLRAFRQILVFGVPKIETDETFSNLTMDPNSGRFVSTIVNQQSALINVDASAAPAAGEGYSRSGILVDPADDDAAATALNGQVNAAAQTITISVDGQTPVLVVLPELTVPVPAGANPLDAWEQAINTALTPVGAQITATLQPGPTDTRYVEFRSTKAIGGSVVVSQSPITNATAALQLGVGQGGIEVSGHGGLRPAPTGFFARFGGTDTPNLTDFAGSLKSDFGAWTLTDVSGVGPHTATPVFSLPAGSRMYVGTPPEVGEGSLLNVRENLQLLADSINNNPTKRWRASLQGLRLVLRPQFGGVNTDTTATLTSDGGFDIGAANQLFEGPANAASYSLGGTGIGSYQDPGATGQDGGVPDAGDYQTAFDIVDRDVDLFNIMLLPRAAGQSDGDREELWGPASVFCQRRRAFLLVDPRSSWLSTNDVFGQILELRVGLVKDHSAIYWPRVTVSTNGSSKFIDPSGSLAGLMARTDSNRGVWKAPAGIEADIRGIRGVEHTMSDPENGVINPRAVNAIRVFATGIVSWGARTMDGFDDSGNDDYKYVPVRRLALFIEESLFRGLKFAVFEPNDEPLWGQIRIAAGAFMNNLFRQGAFQGQKASDAYFVKVDAETTTQNDINLGIVNVVVGFAPLKPAEFVIITIQQKAGQVQT